MKILKIYTGKIGYAMIALVLVLSACRKLVEKPKSVITPDTFYKNATQLQSGLVASMNTLWGKFQGYGDAMNLFNQDDQITRGDLNIPDDYADVLWEAHYSALLNINTVISALNKGVPGVDQATSDALMGQAKFLRAFNYFMLVRMFGGVPLITDTTADPFTVRLARSSVENVYTRIIEDFTEAINKLPVSNPSDQQGLPTKDAAKGLLAKAYLTMATFPLNKPENYAKAADLAGQIISDANYSLVPDVKDLFSLATKYGPEAMWSFNSNAADPGPDPHIWSDMRGYGDICAEPTWEQAYPASPRKDAFIETELDGVKYYDLGDYWPGVKKFQYDSPSDFDAGRSLISMPIIRLADVLLIFAEADNMSKGGPSAAAVAAINRVIDRGNGYVANSGDPLATTSMTMQDFDDKVFRERDLELCFEMDRWFDLIRKHKLLQYSLPDYQPNFSEDDYLFPIPSNDIKVNPLLVQNPGY